MRIGFKFVLMNDYAPFQGRISHHQNCYMDDFLNLFRTTVQ